MAAETPSKPAVKFGDRELSVKGARKLMAELTDEAAMLRDDESAAAKGRRVEIARQLRAIQNGLDALEEVVDVIIPPDASKQFPFRIGPKEFWPGTHAVRASVAQTLRHMMDQHRTVEAHIHVAGGNVSHEQPYGRELPAVGNAG